jgi:hypothetical protein
METSNFTGAKLKEESIELNPAYEKNQRRERFLEKYRQREKMTFDGDKKNMPFEFECIDISPEGEKTDKPAIFIAVGTPSNWEQMEDFVFQLLESGRRVTALAHPNSNLKESFKYDPKIKRPLAMKTFFEKKQLANVTVIAHSFGLLDTVRKGTDGIGRIVAINPAGLSENNPLDHFISSLKSVKNALLSDSKAYQKTYIGLIKSLLRQQPLELIRQIRDVGSADLEEEVKKIAEMLIILRNNDDSLLPPKKATKHPFKELTTGGDHLGLFLQSDQVQEIIQTITELEKNHGERKISEK